MPNHLISFQKKVTGLMRLLPDAIISSIVQPHVALLPIYGVYFPCNYFLPKYFYSFNLYIVDLLHVRFFTLSYFRIFLHVKFKCFVVALT